MTQLTRDMVKEHPDPHYPGLQYGSSQVASYKYLEWVSRTYPDEQLPLELRAMVMFMRTARGADPTK